MKNPGRILAATVIALMLVSCNEQDKLTDPASGGEMSLDNTGLSKPGAAASQLSISVSPTSAEIGDVLTISGSNFGATKSSSSYVTIKGIVATMYLTWTNTTITLLVPSGSTPGAGTVVVQIKNKSSNAVNFTLNPSSDVTIGNQVWMGANLDVATFRNNDPIPHITDSAAWHNATTAGWCYYNNDPVLGSIYGKLYNWYAVNDPRGLAPTGWHIPSDGEWKTLSITLGMSPAIADLPDLAIVDRGYFGTDEGGKMKEAGTNLWMMVNSGSTNISGFTALPGGMRHANPAYNFTYVNTGANWWTATEADPLLKQDAAWSRALDRSVATTFRGSLSKKNGFSVRCVRD